LGRRGFGLETVPRQELFSLRCQKYVDNYHGQAAVLSYDSTILVFVVYGEALREVAVVDDVAVRHPRREEFGGSVEHCEQFANVEVFFLEQVLTLPRQGTVVANGVQLLEAGGGDVRRQIVKEVAHAIRPTVLHQSENKENCTEESHFNQRGPSGCK
jgi:hypothetical protein